MKIVHLVLSESFAGIEQHVDEILSTLFFLWQVQTKKAT